MVAQPVVFEEGYLRGLRSPIRVPSPFFAEFDAPRGVHVKKADRRATCWSKSENVSDLNDKVFSPHVFTRVE